MRTNETEFKSVERAVQIEGLFGALNGYVAALHALTDGELVRMFEECCVAREQALGVRKRGIGVRLLDVIEQLYRELRMRGLAAQRELLPLLSHDNPGVRRFVGFVALEFAPTEAERALRLLARNGGLAGYEARLTLEQWLSGKLSFP